MCRGEADHVVVISAPPLPRAASWSETKADSASASRLGVPALQPRDLLLQ